MTHDTLCPCKTDRHGCRKGWPCGLCFYCRCDLIAKVRQDMLAKCIAAVEALEPPNMEYVYLAPAGVVAVLRALQEKP